MSRTQHTKGYLWGLVLRGGVPPPRTMAAVALAGLAVLALSAPAQVRGGDDTRAGDRQAAPGERRPAAPVGKEAGGNMDMKNMVSAEVLGGASCCFPDGSCRGDLAMPGCIAAGGVFRQIAGGCGNPCPPVRACCFLDGGTPTCRNTFDTQCANLNGTWNNNPPIACGDQDCNNNGLFDLCDIQLNLADDCNNDGFPDSCGCPPVEVVFVMDTSGSMDDEADALCDALPAVVTALQAEGITAVCEVLGITFDPGNATDFDCLNGTVKDTISNDVPGSTTCGSDLDNPQSTGTQDDRENWASAVAIVAADYGWQADHLRIVVPISDEGPCGGNPCTDAEDGDAITNAIFIANLNQVIVSPIVGAISAGPTFDPCVVNHAATLAAGTGGMSFNSGDPANDLFDAIFALIADACTDCDGNDVPDSCEIADDPSLDCNDNMVLDVCDIADGLLEDCNKNDIPDYCEIQDDPSLDCNDNDLLDECELGKASNQYEYQGHVYFLTTFAGLEWPDAEANAQAYGGHLVSVNSQAEEDFLQATFFGAGDPLDGQQAWMGLNDVNVENDFRWSDGSPVTFTNWCNGEPNNAGNEDFGILNWLGQGCGGGWNDGCCTTPALQFGIIELDPSGADCDGNMLLDECEIEDDPSKDCNDDGFLDICGCPPIHVVFVMDTSGSMVNEAQALCDTIPMIQTELVALNLTSVCSQLGIVDLGGNPANFPCLTDSVKDLVGNDVPGATTCGPDLDDPQDSGAERARENWASATAVLADGFPWLPGHLRVIVPISDEGPCGGNPCATANDSSAIANAISVANDNDVIVSPITGDGSDQCTMDEAAALAAGTGGMSFNSSDPATDLANGIFEIIASACTDCDGNMRPDECDIEDDPSLDCNMNDTIDTCEIIDEETADPDDGDEDDCPDAAFICPGINYVGDSDGAIWDVASGLVCGVKSGWRDVWYRYRPCMDGIVFIGISDAPQMPFTMDAVMSIHTACPTEPSDLADTLIVCNHLNPYGVTFMAQSGYCYWIRVAGNGSTTGTFGIEVIGPDCALAPNDLNCDMILDECQMMGGGD